LSFASDICLFNEEAASCLFSIMLTFLFTVIPHF
jgi:hypothetical protein